MRNALKAFVLLAAGLAIFAFTTPQAAAASAGGATITLNELLSGEATSSLVQEVSFRCRDRNAVCARRWGAGPRYRQCMANAGCLWWAARGCRSANRLCRGRWGGGPDYRRCMRIRGC